jgi:predicted Zn-dependent protease
VEFSRRQFVTSVGVAFGGVAMAALDLDGLGRACLPVAGSPTGRDLEALASFALSEARRLGCTYADVAIHRERSGRIWAAEGLPNGSRAVAGVTLSDRIRFRVRVAHSQGLGLVDGSTPTRLALRRALAQAAANARAGAARADQPERIVSKPAREDRWLAARGPVERSLDEPLARLVAANRRATRFRAAETYFVCSKGSFLHPLDLSVA